MRKAIADALPPDFHSDFLPEAYTADPCGGYESGGTVQIRTADLLRTEPGFLRRTRASLHIADLWKKATMTP